MSEPGTNFWRAAEEQTTPPPTASATTDHGILQDAEKSSCFILLYISLYYTKYINIFCILWMKLANENLYAILIPNWDPLIKVAFVVTVPVRSCQNCLMFF